MAKRDGKTAELLQSMDLIEPTQEELDLQSFLEDVGPAMSSVDLYRVHRDGRKAYKARLLFQDLKENAMEFIRTEHGAGKWLLTFRDAGGKIKGNKLVEIEPPTGETQPVSSVTPAAPVDHLQFMREQMAMQQNLITALIANSNKGGPDMGQLFTGMAAMLGVLNKKPDVDIATLLTALKPPDPSVMLTSMVQVFSAMKGTTKDDDWIEKTSKLVGLAREISSPNGGDGESKADSMWGVVSEVGKHVADRFIPIMLPNGRPQQLPAPRELAETAMPRVLASGDVRVETQTGEEETVRTGQERMMHALRTGLSYLKEKAKLGKDPLAYVDLILGNQEEPQWQALLYAMSQGATFETLLTFDPEIAENPPTKDWFKIVFDNLYEELHAGNQPDNDDTGGAGGDANNPPADEKPSAEGTKPVGDKEPSQVPPKSKRTR